MGEPIFISRDTLGMGLISAIAVRSDASRVYLGRRFSSDRTRMNLTVVALDATGKQLSQPKEYRDSQVPLPVGARTSIEDFLLDETNHKLWMASSLDLYALPEPWKWERRLLTRYELDPQGDPVGDPQDFFVDAEGPSLMALARHPLLNLLYMVSDGDAQVRLQGWGPDPAGLFTQAFPVGDAGKTSVAISPGGERLYFGTYPDLLEIVDLDATGLPIANTYRSRSAGFAPGAETPEYYRFLLTSTAIYRRPPMPSQQQPPKWPLVVWPLDLDGNPKGGPQEIATMSGRAIGIDWPKRLWVASDDEFTEAFTGTPIRDGLLPMAIGLDPDGQPGALAAKHEARYEQEPLLIEVAANGTPVILTQSFDIETHDLDLKASNQISGYSMRATVLAADLAPGKPQLKGPLWIASNREGLQYIVDNPIEVGTASEPTSLDTFLRDLQGQVALKIGGGEYGATEKPLLLDRLQMRIQIFDGQGLLLKTMEDEVQGNHVVVLVSGYGFMPPGTRVGDIELMSTHAQRYVASADAVAVAVSERPKKFVLACSSLIGNQGHIEQLRLQAQAVSALGINAVNAQSWYGIVPATINTVLNGFGLAWRSAAEYAPLLSLNDRNHTMPLVYFDFHLRRYPALLDKWAGLFVDLVAKESGGSTTQLINFKLADEPAWDYTDMLAFVRRSPEYMADFHAYLEAQGYSPDFFGKTIWAAGATKWDGVNPIGAAPGADLATRHRSFWTMRFFTESAAKGLALAASAIELKFGHTLTASVNWNNFTGSCYRKRGAETEPDLGFLDWLMSGRLNARTLWTEDWFSDRDAQNWSVRADALRSSAMLGPQTFGAYVVGKSLSNHPAGASYKVLSLIGHGAKEIDFYTFGPGLFFADGWSERSFVYKAIADAVRLVGRAEPLLFAGKPQRGAVALLLAGNCPLWDSSPEDRLDELELNSIHHALVHAGYSVDFVDDYDISTGELDVRGYKALYLTAPNVSSIAQTRIASWVHAGGWLAVTPGAGVSDEYDSAVVTLDAVLGLEPRKADRIYKDESDVSVVTNTMNVPISASAFGAGDWNLIGRVIPLHPTEGADVIILATLTSGGAAITRHAYGAGTVVAYGFFPGWQYWQSALDPFADDGRLPSGWGDRERRCVTAPAVLAGTPKAVIVSHVLVEACVLKSAGGTAVVLLNWSGQAIGQLSVTLPGGAAFLVVKSAQGTPLVSAPVGPDLEVKLLLEYVDVLTFE